MSKNVFKEMYFNQNELLEKIISNMFKFHQINFPYFNSIFLNHKTICPSFITSFLSVLSAKTELWVTITKVCWYLSLKSKNN